MKKNILLFCCLLFFMGCVSNTHSNLVDVEIQKRIDERNQENKENEIAKQIAFTPTTDMLISWMQTKKPTKNYKKILDNFLESFLIDPYSAKKIYMQDELVNIYLVRTDVMNDYWYKVDGTTPKEEFFIQGWGGVVKINSKNRLGAYTGAIPYLFLIKHDELIFFDELIKYPFEFTLLELENRREILKNNL